MPIASLTALGSASGDVAGAVAAIVDYLEGRQSISAAIGSPALDGNEIVGYYADTKTSESLGWWSGRGVNGIQLAGAVEPAVLAQVLLGRHPQTGEQLVASNGSAGRALAGITSETLTVADTARALGLSQQRIRQLASAEARLHNDGVTAGARLSGRKHGREWRFDRTEIERFQALQPQRPTAPALPAPGEMTVADAARQLGVSERRVQALAATGTKRQELLDNGEDVDHLTQWLTGRKNAKQWRFDPAEIARAAHARTVPRVVVAYDFTLSVEKSIHSGIPSTAGII